MELRSINPANGEILGSFAMHGPDQVESKIKKAAEAFKSWRRSVFAERSDVLIRCAEILEAESQRWGELMTLEMGKPRQAGIDEALKCAKCCRYYAENSERFLADEPAPAPAAAQMIKGERRFIAFQPLGPVLAIMPWNFPFWQVFRFLAPALMAGNSALLKHASNVPQCALAIEEILRRAGAPEGVFQILLIGSREVGAVVGDSRISAITLTGSEKAGSEVASRAGANVKKVVLELGGSDPFIVMPSADIDSTVQVAIKARTINNGESCIAAKRFIVHESIADEFSRKFAEGMKALRVGDPMDPKTEIGPLATAAIRDELADQVERSVKAGARILTGGKKLSGPGNYFEPTVLTNISRSSPAWHEEFFGPVALFFQANNLDEALQIANDSPFGLGSSFWSADLREQEVYIREIEAGMAFVNSQVVSDPSIPFGGVKKSGYGRELSHFGIREFTNIKTVVMVPSRGSAQATE
ncbi:MAG TPA: NADP-dependent succinic semialdehyde dehydrogenase [Bdellovibrionales bacterium]|nr:MAG: NADP-dependent succinic semialdehyde dehydrogenase [Bdellovibrionales bacterium GWB1_52_6]OFZ05941.1 MAG: NADP-dependent succinic semialdehyde dehydrogenase [Bdellovibrionales bacterium GWA1_52_35]OFZ37094.1 MAG: NADP-dependent succinic semialdehyde dehydrogenase [Bdellovibrionales bacterium GWC1_52_8]HAR41501.1 NADP-dependent succinic semialdehyde dehydrogenase [Bdellovibrionales bacterium]HCM39441.1 NADP-dependent succinic semialdehyde dehydrogenase [Bdellovibrionales bacterium]